MQLLLGNGISKILIDALSVNFSFKHRAQDAKCQGTTVYQCKDNVRIIFIYIAF